MTTRIRVARLHIVPSPRETPPSRPEPPKAEPSTCGDPDDDDDPPPSGATLKWGPDFIEC